MSTAIALIVQHWQKAAVGLVVVFAVLFVRERDSRIRSQAVAEERTADFMAVDSAYRVVALETQETLAKLRQDSLANARRLEAAEAETERLSRVAEEASQQAIETGRTLGQTLRALEDSAALAQWREHLSWDQRVERAHRAELESVEEERDLWRATARIADRRFRVKAAECAACERAVNEARSALEARVQTDGDPWYEHTVVRVLTHAGALYAGYEVGRRIR